MGFPILVRWHLHIESGPCGQWWGHEWRNSPAYYMLSCMSCTKVTQVCLQAVKVKCGLTVHEWMNGLVTDKKPPQTQCNTINIKLTDILFFPFRMKKSTMDVLIHRGSIDYLLILIYCYHNCVIFTLYVSRHHNDNCGCSVDEVHDDVITWKPFPHYWPFVRGATCSFPNKRPVTRTLLFS